MQLQLGELATNTKGGKYLPVSTPEGPAVHRTEWLRILWHPNAFNDPEARRVNICFELLDATAQFFRDAEAALLAALAERTQKDSKILGKAYQADQLEARFVSCQKQSQRGVPFLKAKLNWDRVRIWDADGEPIQEPGDLAGRSARARLELRQLWSMPPQCGLMVAVTDLQLEEPTAVAAVCPFL